MTATNESNKRERINKLRASAALKIIINGQTSDWLVKNGLMNENGAAAVSRILEQYSIEEIKNAAGQ